MAAGPLLAPALTKGEARIGRAFFRRNCKNPVTHDTSVSTRVLPSGWPANCDNGSFWDLFAQLCTGYNAVMKKAILFVVVPLAVLVASVWAVSFLLPTSQPQPTMTRAERIEAERAAIAAVRKQRQAEVRRPKAVEVPALEVSTPGEVKRFEFMPMQFVLTEGISNYFGVLIDHD